MSVPGMKVASMDGQPYDVVAFGPVTIHEELVHVTIEPHRCLGEHRHLKAA